MNILVPRPHRITPCFLERESQEAWKDLGIFILCIGFDKLLSKALCEHPRDQWQREVSSHSVKGRVWSMVCRFLSLSGLLEMHSLPPHGTDHSQTVEPFRRNSRCLRKAWVWMLPLWGLEGTLSWHKTAVLAHEPGQWWLWNRQSSQKGSCSGCPDIIYYIILY